MTRFLCLFLLLVLPVLGDERILSFHSDITVELNGDLSVTETITVRAEGREIQRGIFRDIPRLQQTKWGLKTKKPFEVVEVRHNGEAVQYEVSSIGKGGVRIRIGDPGVYLRHGEHTYEIRYVTERQLYFEDDRDVLYWNVNGTEWGFPTDKVTASVTLPSDIGITRLDGSTGRYKEEGTDFTSERIGNRAEFASTRAFGPKEGLTVVVEWPSDSLAPEAYENRTGSLLREHPGVLAALLLLAASFGYYLVAWFKVGRDPAKGTIIPQYEPPPGFSPAAARYLHRMGFDNTCFSAAVVGLAAKGVIRINQNKKTYTLESVEVENQKEALEPDEIRLYNKLLGSRRDIELKQSNHATIGGARKALQKILSSKIEKTHFIRNLKWWFPGLALSLLSALLMIFLTGQSPAALFMIFWLSIWSIGTTTLVSRCLSLWRSGSYVAAVPTSLFALPFVVAWFGGAAAFLFTAGPWAAVTFVIAAIMNILFYHLIKAPTHLGRKVMDHLEGFRHYLSVAEEDRLNLHNPPDRTPELFERFMPYALALDCEQQWATQFDEILHDAANPQRSGHTYRPSFYSGSHTGMDRAMGLAALGGALTGALASSSSAPSSGGSSGGGGGFSGGGGGGGGGGGW